MTVLDVGIGDVILVATIVIVLGIAGLFHRALAEA